MNRLYSLFIVLFCAAALLPASPAHGQISVDLQIKRRTFIRYEPVLATVNVTNLSGRDLNLEDGNSQWFGFQINTTPGDGLIPPIDPHYKLEPLVLKAGQSVKRTVNLNTLFSLGEFGRYKIKATIYSVELDKYFASKADAIDISEGRVIWQQAVGVPDGLPNAGDTHTISLLSTHNDERQLLYARIEDRQTGTVFCTHQLGHTISGHPPQVQLDGSNNLFVLQLVGPKAYLLTKIGVNGDFLGQTNYSALKTRPYMRRLADGQLQLIGGRREVAQNAADQPPIPKLSDRPAGLPTK